MRGDLRWGAAALIALTLALAVWPFGQAAPTLTLTLASVALAGLVLVGRALVLRGAPHPAEVVAACSGVVALAAAVVASCMSMSADLLPLHGRKTIALLAVGGLCLAGAALGRRLLAPFDETGATPAPDATHGPGTWLVAVVGGGFHVALACALPPLEQIDSYCNIFEPIPFNPHGNRFHHTPIYAYAIHWCWHGDLVARLGFLVAVQHGLTIAMALGVERFLRRRAGVWIGAAGGLAVALDPSLAVYAQSIMSETVATALLLAAVLALDLTLRADPRWGPWGLLVAGGLGAATLLTKQAFQLWWALPAAWCVALGPWRPRGRAAAILAAGALAPTLLLALHNFAYFGKLELTAVTARALFYRVAWDMPPLTDPRASPDDELERARRIVSRMNDRRYGWYECYQALEAELGWDEPTIERALVAFYVERVTRDTWPFVRVTCRYVVETLTLPAEDVAHLVQFHDEVVPCQPRWDELPRIGDAATTVSWVHAVGRPDLPRRWPILIVAVLAPLLAAAGDRRLALLLVATVGYVTVVTAVAQVPLPRYRIPAVPFVIMAAGLGVAGAAARLRELRGRP